mgnify:CR=1 FL=1
MLKKWPYYNDLIELISNKFGDEYKVVTAPGPSEINDAKDINALALLDNGRALDISQLTSLIKNSSFVIANDTGPAHLSIALGTPTVVIVGGGHFGSFVPYPEEVRPPLARFIFEDMPCYHCFWRCNKRESKQESFPCVNNVSVDAVWEHTKELLSAV